MNATTATQSCFMVGKVPVPRVIVPSTSDQSPKAPAKGLRARLAAEVLLESNLEVALLIMGTGTMQACMAAHCNDLAGDAPSLVEIEESLVSLLAERGETRTRVLAINTSRANTAKDAVDRVVLGLDSAQSPFFTSWPTIIKLEVLGSLLPDDDQTLAAVYKLKDYATRQGITLPPIVPIINKNPAAAKKLVQEYGCEALRVFGSTIGSNGGLGDLAKFQEVVRSVNVPIIAECGIATREDVIMARRLGASGVLVNHAIRTNPDPVRLAQELRTAAESEPFFPFEC